MKKTFKKAFTLVELIIVIAIIAILAVTAFLLLTKWLAKARDSSRASDLANLDTSLNIYFVDNTKLPMPESYATINSNGTILGYQGVFGESSKDAVGNISIAPKDPNDKEYYLYYVDASYTKYQIGAFNENELSYNSNSVNAVDYSNRFFNTRGNKLGMLLDNNQTPINQTLTGLDVSTGTTIYTAYFDNTNKLSGTGATLQWLESVINNGGNGFDSPKDCPSGFMPVPGSKDLGQPGFCVAKYEMKQKVGTAGTPYISGGTRYRVSSPSELCSQATPCKNGGDPVSTLDGKIESKSSGMPIAFMNVPTAMQACKAMGNGYHLLTNKEYMTIARNIEMQGENRNTGIIGSGGIYRGKNGLGDYDAITNNTLASNLDCIGGQTYDLVKDTKGLVLDGTSTACTLPNGRNKRELKLSNNQWIWDFAGNARESVNKGDTIDGTNLDSSNFMTGNACSGFYDNWRSLYTGDGTDVCQRSNGYNYNLIGPLTPGLNALNGVGGILLGNTTETILVRGGGGEGRGWSGIYSIATSFNKYVIGHNISFRCAR